MKKLSKAMPVLLAFLLISGLLNACGRQSADAPAQSAQLQASAPVETPESAQPSEPQETPESSEPDFESWGTVSSAGLTGGQVEFRVLPDGYNAYETEHKMTSALVHYTTDVYGGTYEKFCRVYLPYGYDPEDTDTRYNVVYFQHGMNGSPNVLEHDLKSLHALNLLNNMFDPDHQVMEPVILVCPTYYFESTEDSYTTPGNSPAGDGWYKGIEAMYHREVIEDLIPAVESRFNTYCTDFSEEGIRASRDHRAWAGYSRGGMCTWYMFHNNFEYFSYWMPMSAPMSESSAFGTPEDFYAYIKEPVHAHGGLDFFVLATAGGDKDKGGSSEPFGDLMFADLAYCLEQGDVFTFGSDPDGSNLYFLRSDFLHNDLYFPYSLANGADILFH